MVRVFTWLIAIVGGLLFAFGTQSCERIPVQIGDLPIPGDTLVNPPPDDTTGTPCDPDVIYFSQQVLPILQSSCAKSGCHDAASHQDGVVLDSYENVMKEIKPFDLDDSEIFEVITEDDPDKLMPPPPNPVLTAQQIDLIATWILQGAKDLSCDPDAGGCDTTNVSFAGYVFPVLQNYCLGCHGSVSPSGGIDLSTHQKVAAVAQSGQLYGAIAHQQGYSPMPQNGPQLSDCRIQKIQAWIQNGAPNN
jgi:mono/diheme cytochrome c family protein